MAPAPTAGRRGRQERLHFSRSSRSRASPRPMPSGFQALKDVDLDIRRGEIFALLGPNGAGKTTLISIICGIVNPTRGHACSADGHDIVRDYRAARAEDRPGAAGAVHRRVRDGLGHGQLQPRPVRQAAEPGLYREGAARPVAVGQEGQQDHDALRRHEAPRDDRQGAVATSRRSCSSTSPPPASTSSCAATCGRWCARLRESGVTIILTTHYIEEAEEMADRIGVINKGEIILVEDKAALMRKLGKKQLTLHLQEPLDGVPAGARRLRRSSSSADGDRARLHLRRPGRATPASPSLLRAARRARHRLQGPADRARARSRRSSSAW